DVAGPLRRGSNAGHEHAAADLADHVDRNKAVAAPLAFDRLIEREGTAATGAEIVLHVFIDVEAELLVLDVGERDVLDARGFQRPRAAHRERYRTRQALEGSVQREGVAPGH